MLDFQEVYQSYADEIYRFAFWLAGDRCEAEDIVSETFIRAWVKRDTIRTETLKAYLFTIARNVFLQGKRKGQDREVLDAAYPDGAPGPSRQVQSRLELRRVQKLLQALSEIDRAAFVLRVEHGLPYAEIARVLRISLAASKVKVHRVRKRLLSSCIDKEVY